MKNGEAEWSNDGSLGCDQWRGKVTFLCLKRASADANPFWKLFCKCMVCPHKGPLSQNTEWGFSKRSKGNVVPFPTGSEFALPPLKIMPLLNKHLWITLYIFHRGWIFCLFCCSRVCWNCWTNVFGAYSARRWGPNCTRNVFIVDFFFLLLLLYIFFNICAENQVHFKAWHDWKFLLYLSSLCCHSNETGICLHVSSSPVPSYCWAGHKLSYKNIRVIPKAPQTSVSWFSTVLIINYNNYVLTFFWNRITIPGRTLWAAFLGTLEALKGIIEVCIRWD